MKYYLAILAAGLLGYASVAQPIPDRSVQFPPDWTSHTLLDSELTPGWLPPADDAHAPFRFEVFDVSHSLDARARGRASCRWEFQLPPDGPADNTLQAATVPPERFHALSLWLKNPTGRTAAFSLALRDADDALYTFPPARLGEELNWHELAFFMKDCQPAPGIVDPNPGIQFPVRSITAWVGDLQPHSRYILFLDELRWHVGPPVTLDVVELSSPGTLEAGESAALRFRLRAQSQLSGDLSLTVSLVHDGGVACSRLVTQPVGPKREVGELLAPVEVTLGVPAFAAAGEYKVDITASDARILLPDPTRLPTSVLTVTRTEAPATEASVRTSDDGAPELIVRGRSVRSFLILSRPQEFSGPVVPDSPPDVIRFRICIGGAEVGCPTLAWNGPGEFGLNAIYETCARILSVAPRAFLLPEIRLGAPDWWLDRNTRELVTVTGDGDAFNRIRKPSFASEKWREDAGEALGALVEGLEASAFADHIAGYELASGDGGQWASWDLREMHCADYGGPQKRAFQQWLSKRYGSLENLRSAWNQPMRPADRPGAARAVMTWSDVDLPSPASRRFRTAWIMDPAVFQPVIDYRLGSSDITAEAIDHFAAIVGEKTGRRKVCGVNYGHLLGLGKSAERFPESGLLALGKVLRSSNIDFITGSYPSPDASISRAGKLYLPDMATGATSLPTLQARELRQSATLTTAPGGLSIAARDLQAIAPGRSVAEIAVIVDEESAAYLAAGGPVGKAFMGLQMDTISAIGAPFDVWLMRDLVSQGVPQYRLYLFLNAFRAPDPELDQALSGRFRPEDVVVWLGAAGAIGPSLSGRTMKELTGITTALGMGAGSLRVKLTGSGPLTSGLPPSMTYGLKDSLPPWFQIIDRGADVLGVDPSDRPALVATRRKGHWSVYSTAPGLPADLLRSFAQAAGVHLYAPAGDRVEVSSTFLSITAATPGQRIINLPGICDAWEVASGQQVADRARGFSALFQGGQTRIYRLSAL
ncbi:MAG: beta-galactosidase [Armatimonadetes bacterium]|nr:beta-galactosidase [Armatimonadota bacterium]